LQGVGRDGGIKVYAVLSREDGAEFARNNNLEALFHVDDPGPRVPVKKGEVLDVNQALEMVRFDIQYCDWRARQDLLAIMVLHNKVPTNETTVTCVISGFHESIKCADQQRACVMQVVEVLNPLAREFKSVGTLRKELAELQQELAKAHNQVVCYCKEPCYTEALRSLQT
jgi:chlorophyllide a oxygenase